MAVGKRLGSLEDIRTAGDYVTDCGGPASRQPLQAGVKRQAALDRPAFLQHERSALSADAFKSK
jgi:hypothetical protein